LANAGSLNSFGVTWGGSTILSLTTGNTFGYTEYTFTETASTASTELLFGSNFGGPFFLDDVSVNPAGVGVPEWWLDSFSARLRFARLGCLAAQIELLRPVS
jgi:hypothetical protein